MITVKLTGPLAELAPAGSENGSFRIEISEGMTPAALIESLGVDRMEIRYIVLVNNSRKTDEYVLNDSDSVIIMPLLVGG